MSVKNYHAFIRAARKKAGLSLPAARKVYKKVAARLGRPPKGTDVKKHPRIFSESLNAATRRKAAGLAARARGKARPASGASARASRTSSSGKAMGGVSRKPQPAKSGGAREGRKGSAQKRAAGPPGVVVGPTEYISTPKYRKGGRSRGFNLQLQIHIVGPAGLSKNRLDEIAKGWLEKGETPNGIEVKALGWNGKNPTKDRRNMRVARANFRHIPFKF